MGLATPGRSKVGFITHNGVSIFWSAADWGEGRGRSPPHRPPPVDTPVGIDREFVTSAKKIANFNEFSEIKKNRKDSYKNSLNARVGVAFQWNSLLI